MTEERITTVEDANTPAHTTHTTIITDDGVRKSGGGTWMIILALLLLGAVGAWFISQGTGAEIAKDNAIAEAADNVGDAAGQIGDAAEQAGEAAKDAADNMTGND